MPSKISLAIFLAAAILPSSVTTAQHLYNFVDQPSGNVMAVLELSALPALHTDFVSLTFSPIGESFFGLGTTYSGQFDQTGGSNYPVVEVTPGNLGCACDFGEDGTDFADWDPPIGEVMLLGFANPIDLDIIGYDGDEFDGGVVASGNWIAVPEPILVPHGLWFFCLAITRRSMR
jgi:hypothetical protein